MTEFAIASALGLLILVPVVEFVTKGNAEGVARLLTSAWIPRLRLALLERSLFHWHRKLQAQRQQRWRDLQQMEAALTQITNTIPDLRVAVAQTSDLGLKEVAENHLRDTNALLHDSAQKQADWLRGYRQMITFELERDRYLREDRMNRRRDDFEARIKARQEVVRAMLAFSTADALGGVDHQHKSGLSDDLDPEEGGPDDGGFFALPQIGRSAQDGDGAAAVLGSRDPRYVATSIRGYGIA